MMSSIKNRWCRIAGIILLFVVMQFRALAADKDFPAQPNPPRLVNDFAHVLDAGQAAQLEAKLEGIANATSTQITIVIIKDLGDYDVADYTFKLFNEWGLGQKGKNNGVMLLASIDNHRMNITTGSGLEGALPDITCARIIRNEIAPSFKTGNYYEGLSKGSDAIIAATKGEYKADDKDKKKDLPLGVVVLIIIIIYFVLWLINKMRGGGNGGGNYMSGGGFGGFMTGMFLGSTLGGGGGGWGGGDSGGGGFGGFGGGGSSGGGASGSW